MKLKVPFFKQTTPLNCGPMALRMVLTYLDKDPGIEILEEETEIKEGKGTNTIQIAAAAASLGYKTSLFTTHLEYNEECKDMEYYKEYDDMTREKFKRWLQKCKELGVEMKEKSLTQKELLDFVTENTLPIILIDWNIVKGKEGYQGHFVPIVGYSDQEIYVHNHGFEDTKEFLAIDKETFDKARKIEGTDEDIVVVHKKNRF